MFNCATDAVTPYKCSKCHNFQTYCIPDLRQHACEIHKSPKQVLLYKCSICFFETYSRYLIMRHQRFDKCETKIALKIQENGFKCDICPQEFESSNKLKNHTVIEHENSNCFECEECLQTFKHEKNLKEHNIRSHTPFENIQFFLCDQCPSKFRLQRYLARHKYRVHYATKVKKHLTCPYQCPVIFTNKLSLKRHVNNLHVVQQNHITWFKCDECQETFNTSIDLQNHIDAEHWISCDNCSKKFKDKNLLQAHRIAKHVWFLCDQCPLKWRTELRLREHKKIAHESLKIVHSTGIIRLFECDKCLAPYSTERGLEAHKARQH